MKLISCGLQTAITYIFLSHPMAYIYRHAQSVDKIVVSIFRHALVHLRTRSGGDSRSESHVTPGSQ